VDRQTLADAAPAEGQQALDEGSAALAGDHYVAHVARKPTTCGGIAQRHFAVAKDGAQDVVEVVRDAAREGSK